MNPGGFAAAESAADRTEAERWFDIAEKLLAASDLIGSKRFAERALDYDPLLRGVDQVLAVVDVLLASQRRLNNQINWYSILNLDPTSTSSSSSISLHYRRLALLLNPDQNHLPFAFTAFNLVSDAWSVLSDPIKKSLFDSELRIASAAAAAAAANANHIPDPIPDPDPTFWTACPFCCHVYQYPRAHRNRNLRCQSCRRAFNATELAASPPIVPGTDMYYCSWGFFPLGFPGFGNGWKAFYPMNQSDRREPSRKAEIATPEKTAMPRVSKKVVARKKVGGGLKRRVLYIN